MSPQEKAKKLIEKFRTKTCIIYNEDSVPTIKCEIKTVKSAIQDAILCVEEIISSLEVSTGHLSINRLDEQELVKDFQFWKDVKNHLEELK